jgi:hypothetical protein
MTKAERTRLPTWRFRSCSRRPRRPKCGAHVSGAGREQTPRRRRTNAGRRCAPPVLAYAVLVQRTSPPVQLSIETSSMAWSQQHRHIEADDAAVTLDRFGRMGGKVRCPKQSFSLSVGRAASGLQVCVTPTTVSADDTSGRLSGHLLAPLHSERSPSRRALGRGLVR